MTKEFSCKSTGSDCPFMVRDENVDELVSMVQRHAKDVHDEKLSKDDVLKFTKSV